MQNLAYFAILMVVFTACGPEGPNPLTNTSAPVATEEEPRLPEEVNSSIVDTVPVTPDEEATVAAVRAEYAAVEADFNGARLKMDSMVYDCEADPVGGRLRTYQSTNGDISLIRHAYYAGDHGGGEASYYLKNGKVFFIYVQESRWTFADGMTDDGTPHTRDDFTEYRFYFDADGNPVRCLKKEYFVRTATEIPVDPDKIPSVRTDCGEAEAQLGIFAEIWARLDSVVSLKDYFCTYSAS